MKNHELLRKLGADETIDYATHKFEEVAEKVDLVLDTIGGETQELLRIEAAGGQDMRRSGRVIAQRDRGMAAQKNGAGVVDLGVKFKTT